ncbi:MAG TPA: type II secretion system F family protein [Rhizomicrobium sp.]|nr:type II secretion system F family protein [Rhizomicrobium sp.]
MPLFRYTGVDMAGKRLNGTIEAANAFAVADYLHGRHCILLRAHEVGKSGRLVALLNADLGVKRGLPKAAIAQFTRDLAVMLEAGQDIDRSLRFLVETSDSKAGRRIIQSLRDQVRGGKSLASSLAEHPESFSRLYASLVRAGEAGGQLARSLSHLAGLLERETKLTATIQSALVYPIFLMAASLATIVLLLVYVVPQFTPIFAQAGAELPVQTRVLIGFGDFLRSYGLLILVLLLSLGLLAYRLLQGENARLAAESVLLKVPVVGPLMRATQAARLTRTVGTLLNNGVGLVPALGISQAVMTSLTASRAVADALSKVKEGSRLAPALAAHAFFPLQCIHLLQLGEETGRLGEMAVRVSDIHEDQIQQTIQRLIALMVPVITIVMGIVVAGIVGSLLVAMLSLNDLAR